MATESNGHPVISSMRIARPSRDLDAMRIFYEVGLGFVRLGGFCDHEGYDGVFYEIPGERWHLELTTHHLGHPVLQPSEEDLLVLYVTSVERDRLAANLRALDFVSAPHPNPYWASAKAYSFVDPDGYTVVLCPDE